MAIDPVYSAVLDKALEVVIDVLRPILNRDIDIKVNEIQEASIATLESNFDDDLVMVEAHITGAIEAKQYYFLSKNLAAAITDLMVMGDGTTEFNESESLDGVAEAVNQIVGSQAAQWAEELKTDFNPLGASGSLVKPGEVDIDPANLISAMLKITIADWGEDSLCYFVSKELYDILKELIDPATVAANADVQAGSAEGAGEEGAVKRAEFGALELGAEFKQNGDSPRTLDLLMDISLPVTIELGRTEMLIRDVLELGPGSVIELQKLSGEPVDLYINDKQFAFGEVVVIDENFGIRITELLSVEDRIKALK